MTGWIWLGEQEVLALHDKLVALHGGASGLRDLGLLQSGLARPKNLAAYHDLADVCALAAAYTAAIVQNHPFVDGNKRIGFLLGVLFLELNGGCFTASEESAAEMVIALAAGNLDQDGYHAFLADNSAIG